jgi:hypothetical protein
VRWYDSLQWQTSAQLVFEDTMRRYRIHPADEHLQYGPISTALREMAFDFWQGKPDYSWFFLILAEALADEGV